MEWPNPHIGRCFGVQLGFCAMLLGACANTPPSQSEIAYARSMNPSVEMATNPVEELALERASTLPEGEPMELADGVVIAGPIYAAASGRRCREMTIGPRHRLACEDSESEVWVFVPNVFSDSETTASRPRPSSREDDQPTAAGGTS